MRIRSYKSNPDGGHPIPTYVECPNDTLRYRVCHGKVDVSYYEWAGAVHAFAQALLQYDGERIKLFVLIYNPRYSFYSWIIRAEA